MQDASLANANQVGTIDTLTEEKDQALARANGFEIGKNTLAEQLQDAKRANVNQVDTIDTLALEKDQAVADASELEIENNILAGQFQNATRAYDTQVDTIDDLTEEREQAVARANGLKIDNNTLEDQLQEPKEPLPPKSSKIVLLPRKRSGWRLTMLSGKIVSIMLLGWRINRTRYL